MAICNIMLLYRYGAHDSLLCKAWREGHPTVAVGDEEMDDPPALTASEQPPPLYDSSQAENMPHGGQMGGGGSLSTQPAQEISISVSKRLAFTILSMTLDRLDDNSMRPHWHAWMVFLSYIIGSAPAARLIENDFPWVALVEMLNGLLVPLGVDDADISAKMASARFPSAVGHPLPEDYDLHGFDWAQCYFPSNWFKDARIDSEKRSQEFPSMANIRRERILWLAVRICGDGDWLAYSAGIRSFAVHPALRQRIEASKAAAADVEMATCGHSDDDDFVVI